MPDIRAYARGAAVTESRAGDAWERIQDKPHSMIVLRGKTTLSAQTVRVEIENATSNVAGQGGANASSQKATVFGTFNHPTRPNLDIKPGDIFEYRGGRYRVSGVVEQIGEIQATCERMS